MRTRSTPAASLAFTLAAISCFNWVPAAAADSDAADSAGLQEVLVTAQRRSEEAQNVGIALSVIGGNELKQKAVDTVNDLQNATPSLEVEPAFGSGQAQFRLRGVGFIDYSANNSSPVGVSLDQVALPFPVQTQGQLFDLERVEILRGPQGTLYGRNTTGGAVNFITNKPTHEFHAGASLEAGSYGAVRSEGFISGGLLDTLDARLSIAADEGGAWQYNRLTGQELGGKDKYAGRLQLDWHPLDSLDFLLRVHYSRDRSDSNGLQLFRDYAPGNGNPIIGADSSAHAVGWSLQPEFAQTVGIPSDSRPGVNNHDARVDLTANLDLGFARLTSITSYDKFLRREFADWDATQYAQSDVYYRDDIKVVSEELRLASAAAGPLNWVTGLYLSDDKLTENFFSDFNQSPLVGGTAHTSYSQEGKSGGLFGQVDFAFTSQLKGILGARLERETRELNGLSTSFDIPSVVFIPSLTGPQDRSFGNTDGSGKAGLEYLPAEHTLLYATISRGVKSGGFTTHNTTSGAMANPFSPEKLLAYEIGVKSDVTPTLRINASAFHYDYTDQQILSKVLDTVSKSYIGVFVNVPKSRIDGGEAEVTWLPAEGLAINQYAGYKSGKYTSTILNGDTPPKNFDGQDLSFPKLTYGGNLSYALPLGSLRLTPEFNYSYHDTYSQLFLLGPDYTVHSYWLANANLTLAPGDSKRWSAGLWVRNVFNSRYYLTKNFFLPGSYVAQAGQPTTVGLSASVSF